MDRITYIGNQRKIEAFLLIIYSIYNFTVMLTVKADEWGNFIPATLQIGLLISWCIYFGKWRTYEFRAKVITIMMQICVIIYAVNVEEVAYALPVLIISIVLLGLYGIPELIYIPAVSAFIIFFYHIVFVDTISTNILNNVTHMLSQMINLLLVEYIVYVWTKRNSEGSKKLLETIEELKSVESNKDDFLTNVNHEIRTPLNTICGISELLMQEELPEKVRSNVQDIQMAGRNLTTIVSDILDFSELQSGEIELEEETYNITSTINDIINMAVARKSDKKIELIVDCDANIPSVLLGDEKKLRRIVMNLVDNAIKFTEEGCVTIAIGCRRESYGINLTITIRDTGIGMDEVMMEKMFASFSQADASRRRQEGGIGLGLAISHALVHAMGGAITVRSKLGQGSAVKIVVPQKIVEDTPIASLYEREKLNVAVYIDMEQFGMMAIRDEYSNNIMHMVEQLKGRCHVCRNFAELQRRETKEKFSHIFVSIEEYRRDMEYFDALSKRTKLIVVLEQKEEQDITNPYVMKVYKPFYILTIVAVLNGLHNEGIGIKPIRSERFVTKDVHVLVVDDSRMNIRVVEGMLANYNIETTIALSGREALEKITTGNYDFVFMDHMMPEMDGVETLHNIRQKVGTYYQKVPIVALTANAVAGTREMLLAEGFNDFLEKPIERTLFERVLKRNIVSEKIILGKKIQKSDAQESIIKVQKETVKMETTASSIEETLITAGVDVRQGMAYCGGKDSYIELLRGYCEDYEESETQLKTLFEQKDWTNYTILVHGMKSAMRSIGAMSVSNLAKDLEQAGREMRITYIEEHHAQFLEAYSKLFEVLRKDTRICPPEMMNKKTEVWQKTDVSNLPVLEEEKFDTMIADMEMAAYTLEMERFAELLSELEKYQYKGTALVDVLVPVRRKVEMSDYLSAVEMITREKNALTDKER